VAVSLGKLEIDRKKRKRRPSLERLEFLPGRRRRRWV
jgi:hypothetical protein